MDIKVLMGIYGLKFENINEYHAETFTLSTDNDFRKKGFHNKEFLEKVGATNSSLPFENNVFGCCIIQAPYSIHDKSKSEIANVLTTQTYFVVRQSRDFFNFLWFVKDCSIGTDIAIGHIPEVENNLLTITDKSVITNTFGNVEKVSFSKEEIDLAISILKKYREVCPGKPIEIDKSISYEGSEIIEPRLVVVKGQPQSHKYNDSNRIERALGFLSFARSSYSLPHKIALYIPVFECLFSTDASEVTQKVSERVAFYIGKNSTERQGIFKIIRGAYDLRSKYFHGQSLRSKHGDIDNQKLVTIAKKGR